MAITTTVGPLIKIFDEAISNSDCAEFLNVMILIIVFASNALCLRKQEFVRICMRPWLAILDLILQGESQVAGACESDSACFGIPGCAVCDIFRSCDWVQYVIVIATEGFCKFHLHSRCRGT